MLKKLHIYIIDELMLLPILLINWSLWAVSGFHKVHTIFSGKAWISPDGWIPWLQTHFQGTIFADFTEPLFFVLTLLQVLTAIFLTIAFLKLEFVHSKNKDFLKIGLFLGAFTIACMSFAQNVANDDQDVFELTSYMSTSLISYLFVLMYAKKKN